GERIEVAIVVIELRLSFQTGGSDQAVDAAPHCQTTPTRGTIEIRSRLERLETARPQDGVSAQAQACSGIRVLIADSLEDLAIHEVHERDRRVVLEERREMPIEWCAPRFEKVDPDGRIDDDHARRRR